jgi:hypothetical protein
LRNQPAGATPRSHSARLQSIPAANGDECELRAGTIGVNRRARNAGKMRMAGAWPGMTNEANRAGLSTVMPRASRVYPRCATLTAQVGQGRLVCGGASSRKGGHITGDVPSSQPDRPPARAMTGRLLRIAEKQKRAPRGALFLSVGPDAYPVKLEAVRLLALTPVSTISISAPVPVFPLVSMLTCVSDPTCVQVTPLATRLALCVKPPLAAKF